MGRALKTVRVRGVGMLYPEQSQRQKERGKRYQNHTNRLTGHVTIGLKPGVERDRVPA